MRKVGLGLLLVLCPALAGRAQEFSTEVYPSPDEIREAWRLGELSVSDYIILSEIIALGVDAESRHLLDHIPNLSYFLHDSSRHRTELEREQHHSFERRRSRHAKRRMRWSYVYHQRLQEDRTARYRSSVWYRPSPSLQVDLRLARALGGAERVTGRSLHWQTGSGRIRFLRIGSFSRRLGLGTVVGYRGKLLDFVSLPDAESFLFPDYGGCNGFHLALQPHPRWHVDAQASLNRDVHHQHTTVASLITWSDTVMPVGATVALNRLANRGTGIGVSDVKVALNARRIYSRGYVGVEAVTQLGVRRGPGALVVEGRHKGAAVGLRYAGWVYDDNYIDLSSGSKTGRLSHRDSLSKPGFGWVTRRSGAEGGMVRAAVDLSSQTDLLSSFMISALNRDTVEVQILAGLIHKANASLRIRLDLLNKSRRRWRTDGSALAEERRTRLEVGLKTGNVSARSYIGYRTRTGRQGDVTLFLRVRIDMQRSSRLEMWSKVSGHYPDGRRVDYWYGFVRSEQEILSDVRVSVKLSHRYGRDASQQHRSAVTVEVITEL